MQEDPTRDNAPSIDMDYSGLLTNHIEVRLGKLTFGVRTPRFMA